MNDVCQIEGSILAEDSLAIHYFIYLFKFTNFWDIVEKPNWVKLWLWVFLLFLCLLLTLLNLRCWHSLCFFFLNSIACHTEAPLRASKSCSSCHPKCFEGCVFRVQCQGYRMYEFVYQSLRNCWFYTSNLCKIGMPVSCSVFLFLE